MANYLLWARRNRLGVNPVGVQDGYVAPNSVRSLLNLFFGIGPAPQQASQVLVTAAPVTASVSEPGFAIARSPVTELAWATVKKPLPFTVTIASPAVFSYTAHGFAANQIVQFFTTGTFPSGSPIGIISGYFYYVTNPTANTFEVSPVFNGSSITTLGSQSGTHSLWYKV